MAENKTTDGIACHIYICATIFKQTLPTMDYKYKRHALDKYMDLSKVDLLAKYFFLHLSLCIESTVVIEII